jgi:toxin ParE1/3/4
MGFQVVFTLPALVDLEKAVSFIASDNPKIASSFGFEILGKTEQLKKFPLFGRVVPEFKSENIREIIHRPYRIIYRVQERAKVIEILRIWHGARGIPRLTE